MDKLRLFVSVPVDNSDVTANIASLQEQFNVQGVKLVNPQLFHFSLHFLGDTAQELIPELQEIISKMQHSPFTLSLEQCGVFPNIHNIKVIWIGVSSGTQELISLQQQLIEPLKELNLKLDDRKYTPHLTIGRVKFLKPGSKHAVQEVIRDNQSTKFGSQKVTHLHLMQSTLTPEGPIYKSLFSKEL